MTTADVIVVGGGAVGCAAAYFLAREGVGVRLVEADRLAGQASGAAAGMLAPVGEAEHAGGAGGALFEWGCRSLVSYPELCASLRDRSGIDPEYEPSGLLRVARTESEVETAQALIRLHPELDLEWLAPDALTLFEPCLAPGVLGGLWSPREAHVRSPSLTRAYAAAAQQLGADVREGEPVAGLVVEGDRVTGVRTAGGVCSAGDVILCLGARASVIGEWLNGGFTPPVEPVRGQIVALESPGWRLRRILWDARAYLVPKRDGSVVVGATEERVGFDCRVTAGGVATLLEAASRLVPELSQASFRAGWAGLRPGSPDGLPAIGPVPGYRGLWLAAGHHRNGVLLSAITGQLLRDGVLGKAVAASTSVFDPARWQGGGQG